MMGNHLTMKGASTVSIVMEQFVRMMIHCGMPATDMNLIHCGGRAMGDLLKKAPFRVTQFTGSSGVAEDLAKELNGKFRLEDPRARCHGRGLRRLAVRPGRLCVQRAEVQ